MGMIAFLVIALVAIAAAGSVVLNRNAVHSALFLVINLFCVAVLYLSLNADFLAIVQIIVYAGAIVVLFLFVITLLNPAAREAPSPIQNQGWLAGLFAVVLLVVAGATIWTGTAALGLPADAPTWPSTDNVHAIGTLLYSQYLFPFEVTSLLLLVAIVGATVLAKRRL
jgi:NADH-quinone oxidoreductase subunit J